MYTNVNIHVCINESQTVHSVLQNNDTREGALCLTFHFDGLKCPTCSEEPTDRMILLMLRKMFLRRLVIIVNAIILNDVIVFEKHVLQ